MLRRDDGFTLVELMVVVLIIGVLLSVAFPLYINSVARAASRTCYQNQRALEGAVTTWMAANAAHTTDQLAGVVTVDHPLLAVDGLFQMPPHCPSAPEAADPEHPTPAEGAYTLDAFGTVANCSFGTPGPHRHY